MSNNLSLSPSQREAVTHFLGPCEVIAGPGSGKTAVLTERITHLLRDRHVSPASILVLTFSKAAALEMQERFLKSCDGAFPEVTFGTFHSVFYNILRLSSPRPVRLVDSATKQRFLKSLLATCFPDSHSRPGISETESEISRCNNTCRSGEAFLVSNIFPDPHIFQKIYREYEIFLSENGYTDFDGMLTGCLSLFRKRIDILTKWQERFHFLLVDEFQDINPIQYEAVRLLCGKRQNLFVVGDDDQSIYGFRGSDPSIMQNFTHDFPNAKKIFLSDNYRCSGAVTKCAGLVISENHLRIPKNIRAVSHRGKPVKIQSFPTAAQENLAICRIFRSMSPSELSDCAVIYRTHQQSMGLRHEMDRLGIPYAGKKQTGSRAQEEVLEEICAYFRAAYDFQNRGASRQDIYHIMNRPQRLFPRDICRSERVLPQQLLQEADRRPGIREDLIRFVRDMQILPEIRPGYAMRYLFGTMGYSQGALHGRERYEGEIHLFIDELLRESGKCADSRDLRELLEKKMRDLQGGQDEKTSREGVHIMTMHACKGLQFQKVFLPDLNEGVLPNRRADTPQTIEEERRLFYVAITRAKEELTLMYIGGTKDNQRRPTRFLRVLGVRAYE